MSKLPLILVTLIAVCGLQIAGCGSGQDRSAKTSSAAAEVGEEVTTAKQQLDQVVRGLREMRDASDSADLKKLYRGLRDPAGDLRDTVEEVQEAAEEAATAARTQNDEWRQQADAFTDSELRNASSRRQNDLRNATDALTASTANLKATTEAWTAQLDQALTALDLDLSQQGLQAIKPSVVRLIEGEAKLRDALNDVSAKSAAVNRVINP